MGLLDALIGNVLGSALGGGNQRQTHLVRSWADLPAVTRHRVEICPFNLRYRCFNRMAAWREFWQVTSRRLGATSGFLGKHRPEHEHLSGSAATDIRLVDNERSGGPAWHAARAGRLDDGAGAAGAHQPADSPRSSAGEWRRGNRPGVSDAGQSRATAPGVSRKAPPLQSSFRA